MLQCQTVRKRMQTILIIDDGFLGKQFANFIVDSNNRVIVHSDSIKNLHNSIIAEFDDINDIIKKYDVTDTISFFQDITIKNSRHINVVTNKNNEADVTIIVSKFYGPYQQIDQLIPKIILSAFKQEFIEITDTIKYDWAYLTDCLSAINRVLFFGYNNNNYEICTNQLASNFDIARIILKKLQLPLSLIDVRENSIVLDNDLTHNNSSLRQLGWKSTVNLEDGLEKTINWYRKNYC